MLTFAAAADLNPGGIIAWLVIGLIAGWLAGQFVEGGGLGILGDIIVGLVGAFLGGIIAGLLLPGSYGFWGSLIIAFIGAVVLLWIVRAFTGNRSRV